MSAFLSDTDEYIFSLRNRQSGIIEFDVKPCVEEIDFIPNARGQSISLIFFNRETQNQERFPAALNFEYRSD